jgi:hypothetical protein
VRCGLEGAARMREPVGLFCQRFGSCDAAEPVASGRASHESIRKRQFFISKVMEINKNRFYGKLGFGGRCQGMDARSAEKGLDEAQPLFSSASAPI